MKRAAAQVKRGFSLFSGAQVASGSPQPRGLQLHHLQQSQQGFATAAAETASQLAAQLKKPDPRFLGIAGVC